MPARALGFLLACAACAVCATAADAASPDGPAPWQGAYFGLGVSETWGDLDFRVPFLGSYSMSGSSLLGAKGHIGYLWQRDNFVLGGEVAYTGFSDEAWFDQMDDESGLGDYVVDAKLRAGHTWNRLLIYGVVGYSFAEYDDSTAVWEIDGPLVGVGAEFLVTRHLSVGTEYLLRKLEGICPDFVGAKADLNLQELSIRATVHF